MKIEKALQQLPVIETKRLVLRKIELSDLEDIFEFSSDAEVARYMTWKTQETKEETLHSFIEVVIKGYEKGTAGDWAIELKENSKVIGTCSFIDWSNQHSRAELGYVLNRNYWGKGLASEAVHAIIEYGFETLLLNRIEGGCDIQNTGSEKVMLKAGMAFEGVLRKNLFIKGRFCDTKIFSILREDFSSRIKPVTPC